MDIIRAGREQEQGEREKDIPRKNTDDMPYMLKWCLAVRSLGVLEVIRHAIECLGSLTVLPCPLCLATGLPIILMVAVYSFIWLTFFGMPNILVVPRYIQGYPSKVCLA